MSFYVVNILLAAPIYLSFYLFFLLPSGTIFLLPSTSVFPFVWICYLLIIFLSCVVFFLTENAFLFSLSTRVKYFGVPNQSERALLEAPSLVPPELLSVYPCEVDNCPAQPLQLLPLKLAGAASGKVVPSDRLTSVGFLLLLDLGPVSSISFPVLSNRFSLHFVQLFQLFSVGGLACIA